MIMCPAILLSIIVCFLVSEEEVTKEASDIGVLRERYVEELHQALIGGEEERGPPEKTMYLFQLTGDHLSYQKIAHNILVSNSFCFTTIYLHM